MVKCSFFRRMLKYSLLLQRRLAAENWKARHYVPFSVVVIAGNTLVMCYFVQKKMNKEVDYKKK